MLDRLRHLLVGPPLPTQQLAHRQLNKIRALAAFSPDALSSVAYANQEIYLGLVVRSGGAGAGVPHRAGHHRPAGAGGPLLLPDFPDMSYAGVLPLSPAPSPHRFALNRPISPPLARRRRRAGEGRGRGGVRVEPPAGTKRVALKERNSINPCALCSPNAVSDEVFSSGHLCSCSPSAISNHKPEIPA